jgi:hypothetical protein
VYTSLIDRQSLRYNSGLLEFHYGDNEQPNPRSPNKFPHIMLQHTQQHINSLSFMLMRLRFPKHLARTIRAYHSRVPEQLSTARPEPRSRRTLGVAVLEGHRSGCCG